MKSRKATPKMIQKYNFTRQLMVDRRLHNSVKLYSHNFSVIHLLSTVASVLSNCQADAMNHLICKFRNALLALVVALGSGVSVPLAPENRTYYL